MVPIPTSSDVSKIIKDLKARLAGTSTDPYQAAIQDLKSKLIGGGGGGSGKPSTSSSQQAEQQKEQQKEQQMQEIEVARLKAIHDARQQYAINIRAAQGIQGKLQQMQQLNLATARANLEASNRARELGTETAAHATSRYAAELQEYRKEAGTYGKELSESAEIGALKRYQQQQQAEYKKSLLESYEKPNPQNVISAAPSQWQVYKEAIRDRPVTGTVRYILEKAKGFGTQIGLGQEGKYGKFMPLASPYQPEPTGELFQLGTGAAIFAMPYVGSAALTGMGTEHIATKAGREEIKQIATTLQEKKVPKMAANVLAWSIPVAEIGLGTSKIWYPRLKGYIQTAGREKIPTEKLVPKEVLAGRETFPSAGDSLTQQQRARLHLELFKKGEYRLPGYSQPGGYHATSNIFWKGTVKTEPGSAEFPGLYTSYSTSPYFLKISRGGYPKDIIDLFYGDILAASGKPGVMYVTPKGFKIGKTAKQGYAFVPGVKTEVEAIIPPATELTKVAKQYYFTWKGVRVPIDEFAVAGAKASATGTYTGLVSSYSGIPSATTSLSSRGFLISPLSSSLGMKPSSKGYIPTSISKPYTLSLPSSSRTPYAKSSSRTPYAKSSIKPPYKYRSKISPQNSNLYTSSGISPKPSSLTSAIYKITKTYRKPYKPSYTPPYYNYLPHPRLPRTQTKPSILSSALGKLGESFEAFKIVKGKPQKIMGGLTKEQALDIGAKNVLADLRATFGIKPSAEPLRRVRTSGEFKRFFKLFVQPKKTSRYAKLGEQVWIQRKERVAGLGGRLAFRGERAEIKRAKRRKSQKIKWL